jgi:hypothetical protein
VTTPAHPLNPQPASDRIEETDYGRSGVVPFQARCVHGGPPVEWTASCHYRAPTHGPCGCPADTDA